MWCSAVLLLVLAPPQPPQRQVPPQETGAAVAEIIRLGTLARPSDLQRIATALDDANTSMRLAAARMLARAGDRDAIEKIASRAGSAQAAERFEALTILREVSPLPPSARRAAERALTDEDPALRVVAMEVLASDPAAASVPAVAGVLGDGNRDVRFAAVALLAKTPDIRGMVPLLERIDASDRTERAGVIRALGSFGHVDSRLTPGPAVARQLDDDNEEVRVAAIDTVGRIRWAPAVPILRQLAWQRARPALSRRATLALGAIGDDSAIASLVELLREPAPADEVAQALRQAGRAAVAPVAAILADAFSTSAIAAMDILAQLGDRAATPALLRALQNRPTVAISAANALGALRDGAAATPLMQALTAPAFAKAPAVREACLRALAAIGAAAGASIVERAASDSDARVRAAALDLATALGAGLSAGTAIARVRDRDPAVRVAALKALPIAISAATTTTTTTASSAPDLGRDLQDGIPEVARSPPEIRQRLCATLAVVRTPAADAQLITLMENDSDVAVRAAAAWAARSRRQAPPVTAALERARRVPTVAVAANAAAALTVPLGSDAWTTIRLVTLDGIAVPHRWLRVGVGRAPIWTRTDGRGEAFLNLPSGGDAQRVSLAPDDQDALTSAMASGRSPATTPGTP